MKAHYLWYAVLLLFSLSLVSCYEDIPVTPSTSQQTAQDHADKGDDFPKK
ncbi:hypothetical protein CHRY9390_01591 [Chryseobacterium aquaeductus]|uniref:Lipoprotein n=1 Tax=Chryseobacterium aquaeductus TaxID=2675056 RepID=A0A9N8QS46_9FLAO|nr:hypothetical protein [Chryseobacterium aquaeductus]CAA7330912.1 hypothetical protein CHRY9390_01591 [Chryseobacterium potabilaquae]CAD7806962.1 hypothetical protein CHRY9390_01591 [Chryseobacterium aquaeductus]